MPELNIEQIKAQLVELNRQFGTEEPRGEAGKPFFEKHLSDRLLFRRASGKVVGKKEFLDTLGGAYPFKSLSSEEIAVHAIDDRALVTLIVVGTRKDDESVHRYRNARFFARQGEQWILDAWYNFEITGL